MIANSPYLVRITQRVKITSSISEWNEVHKGVPQESTLGPLPLNIYFDFEFTKDHISYTHMCVCVCVCVCVYLWYGLYLDRNRFCKLCQRHYILHLQPSNGEGNRDKTKNGEKLCQWFYNKFLKAKPEKRQNVTKNMENNGNK